MSMNMKMNIKKCCSLLLLLIVFILALVSFSSSAKKPLSGKEIMEKVEDISSLGIGDAIAKVKMLLGSKDGTKRERMFVIKSKKTGGVRKFVLKFFYPPDIAGTGMLVIEKSKGHDLQYLYLPETGKVRKIAGKQSHSSFLSSDFLYWDLRHHDVNEAKHERLPDEVISGIKCMVVKTTPKPDSDAPYGRILTWIAESNFVPLKIDFYDKKGNMLKKLVNSKIERKQGRWIIMKSKMRNVRNGHFTTLIVKSIEFESDISDEEFTKSALMRLE